MTDDDTSEVESDPMPLDIDDAGDGEPVLTVKLTRKQRQVLYRLLERGADLEKMAEYSRARVMVWDAVINLAKIISAVTVIGGFVYLFWTRGGPR